jgi:hypothetical protein
MSVLQSKFVDLEKFQKGVKTDSITQQLNKNIYM